MPLPSDLKNYRALREPNGVWAVIWALGLAALALLGVVVLLSMWVPNG